MKVYRIKDERCWYASNKSNDEARTLFIGRDGFHGLRFDDSMAFCGLNPVFKGIYVEPGLLPDHDKDMTLYLGENGDVCSYGKINSNKLLINIGTKISDDTFVMINQPIGIRTS